MYIKEFYEKYFSPVYLARVKKRTVDSYKQILDLWIDDIGNLDIGQIRPDHCEQFVTISLKRVKPHTVAKYCRQMNTLFLKMAKPGYRNREAFGFINDPPYCRPPRLHKPLPKEVKDSEILRLIDAFLISLV